MLNIAYESQFKKDFKKVKKRGKNLKKMNDILSLLIKEKPLPTKNRNHPLHGNWKGYWECHIEPDWLLIYKKTIQEIILVRTGTHADLF
jgi:mRNA interferase YafQ